LAHHERWDGQGYPKGLKQDEIPLVSRIIAVVDAFDMMIHDQHYAKAMSVEAALIELEKQAGTQFDPFVVETFISNKVYEFKSDGID
jgi:HD-GYP domain-containing protein (c-di-GMP phosphodiesterase class II)